MVSKPRWALVLQGHPRPCQPGPGLGTGEGCPRPVPAALLAGVPCWQLSCSPGRQAGGGRGRRGPALPPAAPCPPRLASPLFLLSVKLLSRPHPQGLSPGLECVSAGPSWQGLGSAGEAGDPQGTPGCSPLPAAHLFFPLCPPPTPCCVVGFTRRETKAQVSAGTEWAPLGGAGRPGGVEWGLGCSAWGHPAQAWRTGPRTQ